MAPRAAQVRPGDSGLDILDRVLDQGLDPWPLLADFETFQAHVQSAPGPEARFLASGDETAVDLRSAPADTTTLVFGPGVFDVTGMRAFQRREPVAHLEIRGAGMDETTLRMGPYEKLMVLARYEPVRIEGLTLDWRGERGLLDVREEIAVILEDVRLREWSSHAILVGGRAYLGCRRCEFTDGLDGRRDWLLGLRGPALATFEDCTFSGLEDVLIGSASADGSRVRLSRCTYEDARLADSRILKQGGEPSVEIRIEGGQVSLGPAEWSEEMRRERWGLQYASSVSGLVLGPSMRRLSLGLLRDALRDVAVPAGAVPVQLRLTGWSPDGPTGYVLETWTPDREQTAVYALSRGEGRTWALRALEREGGHDLAGWPDGEPVPDLRTLLAGIDLPAGTAVQGAGLASYQTHDGDPTKLRTVWDLVVSADGVAHRFDPQTLEAVEAPR